MPRTIDRDRRSNRTAAAVAAAAAAAATLRKRSIPSTVRRDLAW